jgi:hypothetical protein
MICGLTRLLGIAWVLFSVASTGPAEAAGLQLLHQAMELAPIQRPFEEICRHAGIGKSCHFSTYMIEKDRGLDPESILSEIQKGLTGRFKLLKKDAPRPGVEAMVAELFGHFRSSPGMSAAWFESRKQELIDGFRSLGKKHPRNFQALFWSPVDHGKALLILLPDPRYGVTEVGLLTFGESVDSL